MPFVETRFKLSYCLSLNSDPPTARLEDLSTTKWQSTRVKFVAMTLPKRSLQINHNNTTGYPREARGSCGACKTRLQIETIRTSRRIIWTGSRILVRR